MIARMPLAPSDGTVPTESWAMAVIEHGITSFEPVGAADASSVLSCIDLHKRFGELEAVRGVSFRIAE